MKNMKLACAAALLTGATTVNAQIVTYQDDFEDDDINSVLINNVDADFPTDPQDWIVGANVWDEFYFTYLGGYFSYPAPNNNGISGTGVDAFSGIVTDQGGPEQCNQSLVVYSDYNNGDHGAGLYIEANVYRQYTVAAENVGETWTFSFDAKLGTLADNTDPTAKAEAFIKTLNPPSNGGTWNLTNFIALDMTNADPTWQPYSVELTITEDLIGQVFQIGWLNLCTFYEPSGMFYDNVALTTATSPTPDFTCASSCPADLNGDGILDNGDIGTFVGFFLAGNLGADLNGDGILDNGDIGTFVALFLAGC